MESFLPLAISGPDSSLILYLIQKANSTNRFSLRTLSVFGFVGVMHWFGWLDFLEHVSLFSGFTCLKIKIIPYNTYCRSVKTASKKDGGRRRDLGGAHTTRCAGGVDRLVHLRPV